MLRIDRPWLTVEIFPRFKPREAERLLAFLHQNAYDLYLVEEVRASHDLP